MKILVFNSGSSSQKSSLYEIGSAPPDEAPPPLWDATIEWQGDEARMRIRGAGGADATTSVRAESRSHAVERLLEALRNTGSGEKRGATGLAEIDAVGHRIVHGGRFLQPAVITAEVKESIAQAAKFAPLHNAAELEEIAAAEKSLPKALQVAVFDTGFHSQMPEAAATYPGPYEWIARGIRRYGFHGINHQYCAQRCAQMLKRDPRSLRIITCHLGSGCSLAAVADGHSVDTTMGFTPLEGLMMGTRSGSVDPGILTYLMQQDRASGAELDNLLNRQSGLLGISGLSADMRQIVAAMQQGHPRATLAFEIFVHRLRAGIGQMAAALGGTDALVFTGGIGENSGEVRAVACERLSFLGVRIDAEKNARPLGDADADVSATDSAVRVLVIRAQEDWAIAQECWKLAKADS